MKSGFVNCFDWSFTPSQNYVHHCGSSCKNLVERKYSKPSIRFLDIITYNYVYIYNVQNTTPYLSPFQYSNVFETFRNHQGQPFFQPPCLVQRCSVWYFLFLKGLVGLDTLVAKLGKETQTGYLSMSVGVAFYQFVNLDMSCLNRTQNHKKLYKITFPDQVTPRSGLLWVLLGCAFQLSCGS